MPGRPAHRFTSRVREGATYRRISLIILLGLLLAVVVATAAAPSASAFLPAPASGVLARLTDARAVAGQAAGGAVADGWAGGARLAQATVPSAIPSELLTPYEVIASYPHDPDAFLQGLVWHGGGFYESTGLYGQSSLRRVAFPSGEVTRQVSLPSQYFGEGLALVGERLVQLTWRSKLGFVYDRETFELLGSFPYETEGWGLTFDGTSLIMSDGSDVLTYLDPESFQPLRTLPVTLDGQPVDELNELEWIEGEIWANVWQTDVIVRIDPATGQVIGVLDLAGLLPGEARTGREDVLNGIAYDPDGGRIFVGGKRWPLLFEIRVR
ncbi:MAG: glutaminyl-peptide cyclotransferase [Chloroflexota bacterium]|nr:glutaminyl-peptide cyclotransferase [Chloroflexota bacterium]